MSSIVKFIEDRLFLKVNKEKTMVVYFNQIKFLGYSFRQTTKGEIRFNIHPKSVSRMRSKIRELTKRSNGWGNEKRKHQLSSFIKRWVNYYKYADMKYLMSKTDEWYRRRLRMIIWKQWKRIKTRGRNLIKLGVNKYKAWKFVNTRNSYWRTALSPILSASITNNRLKRAGYIFFSDYIQAG